MRLWRTDRLHLQKKQQ